MQYPYNTCIMFSILLNDWHELCFTYLVKWKNETVYQSYDILKPFGKSSEGVNGVIFPCIFIMDLSSFASY